MGTQTTVSVESLLARVERLEQALRDLGEQVVTKQVVVGAEDGTRAVLRATRQGVVEFVLFDHRDNERLLLGVYHDGPSLALIDAEGGRVGISSAEAFPDGPSLTVENRKGAFKISPQETRHFSG